MATTTLVYLRSDLRFHLGDISVPQKFTDAHLLQGLIMGCKTLMKKWRNRYTINSSDMVSRNTIQRFDEVEPPVIERADERAFILQAAIIIKSAEMKDTAWDIGSWRDDEISVSNIAGGKIFRDSLNDDIAELELWLRRRLFGSDRQSLTGFRLPMNIREGSK